MIKAKKYMLAFLLSIAACGCAAKSEAVKTNTTQKTTVNGAETKTNKDGSTEVTLKDGSTITFEKGTSSADIQDTIKAMENGVKESEGSLSGGSDTDQSEDIQASEADSIQKFE